MIGLVAIAVAIFIYHNRKKHEERQKRREKKREAPAARAPSDEADDNPETDQAPLTKPPPRPHASSGRSTQRSPRRVEDEDDAPAPLPKPLDLQMNTIDVIVDSSITEAPLSPRRSSSRRDEPAPRERDVDTQGPTDDRDTVPELPLEKPASRGRSRSPRAGHHSEALPRRREDLHYLDESPDHDREERRRSRSPRDRSPREHRHSRRSSRSPNATSPRHGHHRHSPRGYHSAGFVQYNAAASVAGTEAEAAAEVAEAMHIIRKEKLKQRMLREQLRQEEEIDAYLMEAERSRSRSPRLGLGAMDRLDALVAPTSPRARSPRATSPRNASAATRKRSPSPAAIGRRSPTVQLPPVLPTVNPWGMYVPPPQAAHTPQARALAAMSFMQPDMRGNKRNTVQYY